MKSSVFILLFCCIFSTSYSQFSDYSFDDVTREELQMTDCPFEPGAPAMIIAEKCELVNELGAPYHALRITRRIKILTKEGLSYGNFELAYLNRYSGIVFFQATVYNLENDIIVEEKTKSDAANLTNIDKYQTKYTVSLPNVKVGSVIDIYYKQHNDNMIPIQPWYFQSEIPCGWSEYISKIQKKATYKYHFTDFLPFTVNTIQDLSQGSDIKGGYLINRFAVQNVPSYHLNEPFVLRPQEQISKVELVFDSYNQNSIWGNVVKPVTWNEISDNLLKNPFMGKVIDKGKFLRNPLKEVLVNCNNFEDSLRKVYEYIRQTIKSNGYRNIYARNLQKTFIEKSGNTGEINLLLIAALREAGFDCHPLLLPTIEETPSSKTDPGSNGINFLVAAIFKDSLYYLLDASNREIAFNTLSVKCLNGDGFLISDHNHRQWIPLLRNERTETRTKITYAWTPENRVTVNVEKNSFSLSANQLRYIIHEEGDDEYIKSRKSDYQNFSISTPHYTGLAETDNPIVENFSFTLKAVDYNSTDTYFLQTVPFDAYKENPFDAAKRDFLIDFLAPTIKNTDVTIQIPEGFRIVNLPESYTYSDDNNDLVFDFSVVVSANEREIMVHSGIQIKGFRYSKEEYDRIRQFFSEIVKMQNTFIELKKL
jgi:hypothetical protein